VSAVVLPDDEKLLSAEMIGLADADLCDVIFTTGGTGLSESDVTPEATLAVAHKIVPGIPEAMRAYSMTLTKRAMLSRGAAVIRGRTLIVNLPGSPKAARECLSYLLGELYHGLAILRGDTGDCAR
jgi:molybdenum cofactor synthesis domain-containing protein